ncbi:MAG TPA: hypothetical protein VFZ81_13075 [Burkholderiales bacterium]
MPLGKPRYPFTRKMIEGAPRDMGVYILYRGSRVLYVGRAAAIQSRLQEHMDGEVCACSRRATHYSWEIVMQPQVRELELLRDERERAGALPPCNAHSA